VDTGTRWAEIYGVGNASGTIANDTLGIGGLVLEKHSFGVATTESVGFSTNIVPWDGVMGLAQSVSLSSIGQPVMNLTRFV
jgi:hypothetical protein